MITVVTVTYGERWNYLKKLLDATHDDLFITKIIIVDNGTPYQLPSKIDSQYPKVEVFRNEINTGSAAGFKKGLEMVSDSGNANFILLLDDDNVIEKNAPEILLNSWKEIAKSEKTDFMALAALRTDRKYLMESALGGKIKYLFPLGNDCFGFDIQNVLGKIFYNTVARKKILKMNELRKAVKIPMAPYGGFFFHKRILKKIGYPDERYFAYSDDYEFTHRIHKNGGSIFLISDSRVTDVSEGWINKSRSKLISSKYLEQDDFRAYLSIRNKTYFSVSQLITNRFIFGINLFLFKVYLLIVAFLSNRYKKFKLLLKAIREGFAGNLVNEEMSVRIKN